jgi:hypothetical protein
MCLVWRTGVSAKCLHGVTRDRRYLGVVAKFLGFLLGVAVALAGPAVFGVLAAPGGIELNAKELALAFGIGALVFWAVVSYFSGAGALGAFLAFGTLVYCWLWIPNRTTNFLNDVPGVTTGMIDGSKQYTLNGVVPILGVISLVYGIQLIVLSVQRRRRERAEQERLQREQEAAQAQQEADVAAVYPVAGSTYAEPAAYESHTRYDDLFDEPEPVRPRNQADEQTRQFPVGDDFEHTRQFPEPDADGNYVEEETIAAPVQAGAAASPPQEPLDQEPAAEAPTAEPEPDQETQAVPVAQSQPEAPKAPATQSEPETPAAERGEETQAAPVAQSQPDAPKTPAAQSEPETPAAEPVEETQATPVAQSQPDAPKAPAAQSEPETPEAGAEEAAPAAQTKPVGETRAMPVAQTAPAEAKPAEKTVAPKEQVGSQYRERMEDPEDTGEFHLAFENPVVKPA